jgi:hypothetical protein
MSAADTAGTLALDDDTMATRMGIGAGRSAAAGAGVGSGTSAVFNAGALAGRARGKGTLALAASTGLVSGQTEIRPAKPIIAHRA